MIKRSCMANSDNSNSNWNRNIRVTPNDGMMVQESRNWNNNNDTIAACSGAVIFSKAHIKKKTKTTIHMWHSNLINSKVEQDVCLLQTQVKKTPWSFARNNIFLCVWLISADVLCQNEWAVKILLFRHKGIKGWRKHDNRKHFEGSAEVMSLQKDYIASIVTDTDIKASGQGSTTGYMS